VFVVANELIEVKENGIVSIEALVDSLLQKSFTSKGNFIEVDIMARKDLNDSFPTILNKSHHLTFQEARNQ
jgi:hypothetical protein